MEYGIVAIAALYLGIVIGWRTARGERPYPSAPMKAVGSWRKPRKP